MLTAFGAGFLYAETCYHLNIDVFAIKDQILFILMATLALYNGIRCTNQLLKSKNERDLLFFSNILLCIVGMSYCLWYAQKMEYDALLYAGHLLFLGIAYVLPIFGKPLRDIPFLKLVIIVYVWTAFTAVLPVKLNLWNSDVFYPVFFNRLNFILMMSLAFDICHRIDDAKQQLATLPTVFGEKVAYLSVPLGLFGIITSLNISPQYGVIMAVVDFSTAVLFFQSPSLSRSKVFILLLDLVMFLKFSLLAASTIL